MGFNLGTELDLRCRRAGEVERFMPITISNLAISPSAPAGTMVGVLTARDVGGTIPCNFILSKKSSGYFAISCNNLTTVWSGLLSCAGPRSRDK
jgi:hypothetical protein